MKINEDEKLRLFFTTMHMKRCIVKMKMNENRSFSHQQIWGATFERMVSLLVEKKKSTKKRASPPPRGGAISRAAHIKKWINKLKRLGKEGKRGKDTSC